MKRMRMWPLSVVALAAVVVAGLLIPSAVGASHQTKAGGGTASCTAKGTKVLTNTGVVSVSAMGTSTPAPGSCTAKLTGNWTKNSTKFAIEGTGQATLGAGGVWKLAPGTSLSPLTSASGKLGGTLTGTGAPVGTALTIEIHCTVTYHPIVIRCTIIIRLGSSTTPATAPAAVRPAPQAKAATVLCSAKGRKILDNTGVISVAVKGSMAGSTGTPVTCSGKLTGTWQKNSTKFSWDAVGPTKLEAGGTFRALSGPVMGIRGKTVGTLTGSGLPTGTNVTVDAGCKIISYWPLKIECWIIIKNITV